MRIFLKQKIRSFFQSKWILCWCAQHPTVMDIFVVEMELIWWFWQCKIVEDCSFSCNVTFRQRFCNQAHFLLIRISNAADIIDEVNIRHVHIKYTWQSESFMKNNHNGKLPTSCHLNPGYCGSVSLVTEWTFLLLLFLPAKLDIIKEATPSHRSPCFHRNQLRS